MKYSIYITTTGLRTNFNWHYKSGAFVVREDKIPEFEPEYFMNITAANNKVSELKENGETREIKIAYYGKSTP